MRRAGLGSMSAILLFLVLVTMAPHASAQNKNITNRHREPKNYRAAWQTPKGTIDHESWTTAEKAFFDATGQSLLFPQRIYWVDKNVTILGIHVWTKRIYLKKDPHFDDVHTKTKEAPL